MPERDIESLGVMGWGLAAAESRRRPLGEGWGWGGIKKRFLIQFSFIYMVPNHILDGILRFDGQNMSQNDTKMIKKITKLLYNIKNII